jgi:hypothetical protein
VVWIVRTGGMLDASLRPSLRVCTGLPRCTLKRSRPRVRDWLAGRRGLPRETDAYVRLVTGQTGERWARVQAGPAEMQFAGKVPCQQIAGLVARQPSLVIRPVAPWSVELVGSSLNAAALAAYVFHHGLARGNMLGADPCWGGEPHNCREIVREPAIEAGFRHKDREQLEHTGGRLLGPSALP